jgi:hypothetical protein
MLSSEHEQGKGRVVVAHVERDGREAETTIPGHPPEDVTPAEIALGLIGLLPGVRRIRVWADGLSCLDEPSADARRVDDEHETPMEKYLRNAHAAFTADLANLLDLDAGLTAAMGNRPPATPPRPSAPREWTSAIQQNAGPWHSAFRGPYPPV